MEPERAGQRARGSQSEPERAKMSQREPDSEPERAREAGITSLACLSIVLLQNS